MHSVIRRFDARTRRRIVPHQHSRNAHRPFGNPGVRRRTQPLTIPFASLVFRLAYVCLTGRGAAIVGDAKKPLRTDVEFIDFLP